MNTRPKLIGCGLQKTGTTSLGRAMLQLGYRHQSYAVRAAQMYSHGSKAELLTWAQRYESFDDVPWALIYRELDQTFPGSKFVLTRRASPDIWFESLRKHMARLGEKSAGAAMNQAVFGRPDPQNDRSHAIEIYLRALDERRDYFKNRPQDFIEVCWENGDGWPQLCSFLGLPEPAQVFPHANQAPTLWQRWHKKLSAYWHPTRQWRGRAHKHWNR